VFPAKGWQAQALKSGVEVVLEGISF